MSSPAQVDDDDDAEEVEFVSAGPLRPVLDCIDLLSDSDDEGCSSLPVMLEDSITRHKARVTSTLDRLAHKVALDKKERANKCKAFKEKQILQKAHGQQELAVNSTNGLTQEAKRCVDMWLKMPGLKPGGIGSGLSRRQAAAAFSGNNLTKRTCPVINCGRVYDNISLLDGHLKRFDHSPCDPAIHLRGSPSELFACVACAEHFPTKEEWRKHVQSKVNSTNSDSHSMDQSYQRIVCFACPACCLLFNLRDECLQHMSAKNHFQESFSFNETVQTPNKCTQSLFGNLNQSPAPHLATQGGAPPTSSQHEKSKGAAQPVPIPQLVKNHLISLCKDVAFAVRCSLCHKVLISHQAAQAHFNVQCRQGCAVAKADQTIVEFMKRLQVRGRCWLCSQMFLSLAEIEAHKESTQHEVEVTQTVAEALLQYCRFTEIQQSATEEQEQRLARGLETPFQKRNKRSGLGGSPAKRQKRGPCVKVGSGSNSPFAWFCECGLQFPEEAAATKHLLAANQIFHQCGVCGKLMGESSIARLHMSRNHGGAHLSNFLFFCRKCHVEMPRYEDILSHVSEVHSGHTYLTEKEALTPAPDAKPSTSGELTLVSVSEARPDAAEASSSWMCRMCEDIFDSEAAVRRHCGDMTSHNFQRFVCGHCPQKFFKESTVRRHCANEHGGETKSSHFCGLCDSMQFETEGEFLEHYRSLHSEDYCRMDAAEVVQPSAAEGAARPTCACMGSEGSRDETKATYTRCMRSLSAEGRCRYVCAPCCVSAPSYAQMKTHVHSTHAALNLDKTFEVECNECRESFTGVPSFHKHHHTRHCGLEPCVSARVSRKDSSQEPTTVKIINAVEIRPADEEIEDETLVTFLNNNPACSEREACGDDSEDEMKRVLSLSAEEARELTELEEALQRSLVEF